MGTLIILRGLPGSGKSSLTKYLLAHTYVSMDDFWSGPDRGKGLGTEPYSFNVARIKEAVSWARQNLEDALKENDKLIVVDNTHSRLWEMEATMLLGERYGYEVRFVHVEEDPVICHVRGKHSVPVEKIQEMVRRWEPLMVAGTPGGKERQSDKV